MQYVLNVQGPNTMGLTGPATPALMLVTCCVHCGTGAMAPPGAENATPVCPSEVGPRELCGGTIRQGQQHVSRWRRRRTRASNSMQGAPCQAAGAVLRTLQLHTRSKRKVRTRPVHPAPIRTLAN